MLFQELINNAFDGADTDNEEHKKTHVKLQTNGVGVNSTKKTKQDIQSQQYKVRWVIWQKVTELVGIGQVDYNFPRWSCTI